MAPAARYTTTTTTTDTMKSTRTRTAPVIRMENPPCGSIPATEEQLLALGFTPEELAAGEKRLESTHLGPWQICTSLRGIVKRWEFTPDSSARRRWVEFYAPRTMSRPRSCGYDMEGTISLAGRKSSAFTSSQLFELPDGRLVNAGIIFSRDKGPISTPAPALAPAQPLAPPPAFILVHI